MVEVSGCDAVEPAHPLLEPAVAGVDVLDVKDAVADTLAGGDVGSLMANAGEAGDATTGAGGVGAEQGAGRQPRHKFGANRVCREVRQDFGSGSG